MAGEMDKLIAALAVSKKLEWNKASLANQTAGIWCSLWRATGEPQQGAIPTSAAACDDTFTGSWGLDAPGSGNELYLARAMGFSGIVASLVVFDRLAHMGGLSGTVATAQTVNLSVATAAGQGRCLASGGDVQWFTEHYADTGSTVVTVNASYTDETDTSGRTTPTISWAATRRIGNCYRFDPAQGISPRFIKSIQTVTLSASTLTAGNFGITARKRLFTIPIILANSGLTFDFAGLALPKIKEQSCLEILVLPGTTSSGAQIGNMEVIAAAL